MTQGLPIITSTQERQGLLVVESNGFPARRTYSSLVTLDKDFLGTMDLSNPFGTFWNDYIQTGVLTLVEGPNAVVGGVDRIRITANGSAINVPGTWVNVGSVALSTTPNDVNRIMAVKVTRTETNYTVKVN